MIPYIACDIDGCVYPFTREFRMLANHAYYLESEHRPTLTFDDEVDFAIWKFYETWGMDTEWFRQRYSEWFQDGNLLDLSAPLDHLPDEVVNDSSVEIHWITHRQIDGVTPTHVRAVTENWLARNGFKGALHLATSEHRKPDIITDLHTSGRRCIGVIEDHPGNCMEMSEAGECMGVLIDQPYNQQLTAEQSLKLRRARDVRRAAASIWHAYRSEKCLMDREGL